MIPEKQGLVRSIGFAGMAGSSQDNKLRVPETHSFASKHE
jgi:hypothetical protein